MSCIHQTPSLQCSTNQQYTFRTMNILKKIKAFFYKQEPVAIVEETKEDLSLVDVTAEDSCEHYWSEFEGDTYHHADLREHMRTNLKDIKGILH